MLLAVMRQFQISRHLRKTSRTIGRLGEMFNANDVTNDSTKTERPRVTTHLALFSLQTESDNPDATCDLSP